MRTWRRLAPNFQRNRGADDRVLSSVKVRAPSRKPAYIVKIVPVARLEKYRGFVAQLKEDQVQLSVSVDISGCEGPVSGWSRSVAFRSLKCAIAVSQEHVNVVGGGKGQRQVSAAVPVEIGDDNKLRVRGSGNRDGVWKVPSPFPDKIARLVNILASGYYVCVPVTIEVPECQHNRIRGGIFDNAFERPIAVSEHNPDAGDEAHSQV
jgi:hypothetical protein